MSQVVAGVDSSTQSCTVELRTAESGALLGTGRASHPPTYPPVSEQSTADWWLAFREALAAACRAAGVSPSRIRALSIGAQCHGLVALGAGDTELRPVKLWNDTTSAEDTRRLVGERSQSSWVEQVLVPMNPALTITKLAWLARTEPATLARVQRIMLPHDWLTFRLTGNHVTDRSDASGTGYFFAPEGRYRTELLSQHVSDDIAWDALLPRVLGPQQPAGQVSAAVAEETGLSPACVVGPGGGDQHLAAVGMGLREGETAFSLGTSGVVFTTSPTPVIDPDARIDSVCDATGGYLPLLCTLNCTKVTDMFARLLGVELAELDAMALAATPSELVMVPYLDGERSPMRPDAAGLIAGLRSGTTREDVALAAYQGVVCGLVRAHAVLQEQFAHPISGRVVVVGGGARSLAYRQLIADHMGTEVITVEAAEATARGAAVQAAAVLAGQTTAAVRDAWTPRTLQTVSPRPGRAGVPDDYLRLVAASDRLYRPHPATSGTSARPLAAEQGAARRDRQSTTNE